MKKRYLVRFGLLIVSIVTVILVSRVLHTGGDRAPQTTGNGVGQFAHDFTGRALYNQEISLQDYRGKIIFVNLFASWCGPCLIETPHLVDASRNNLEDVVFVGINLQEPASAVEAYQQEFDIQYPLLMDPEGRFTDLFTPRGLPTSWVIDKDGVIRYVHSGPLTQTMIQNVLDAIRESRQPNPFSSGN